MKVNVEFQEPDRKAKLKRVIAREGFIFAGIIVAGFLLQFLGKSISPLYFHRPETSSLALSKEEKETFSEVSKLIGQAVAIKRKFIKENPIYKDYPEDSFDSNIITAYPEYEHISVKKEILRERTRRIFERKEEEIQRGEPLRKFKLSLFNNLEKLGFFLLIFGYPIYLLIRFFIWAVKILKEKE